MRHFCIYINTLELNVPFAERTMCYVLGMEAGGGGGGASFLGRVMFSGALIQLLKHTYYIGTHQIACVPCLYMLFRQFPCFTFTKFVCLPYSCCSFNLSAVFSK